ncbi:MAG TPA: ATP-binding protein [Patescibacteria group bacterium]|nr:ATP-binding protein [Patescibacteria group bacterium]
MENAALYTEFLARQIDFVFFVNSLAFLFVAAVGIGLQDQRRDRRHWLWLVAFGLLQGTKEWLGLLMPVFADNFCYAPLYQGLLVISFVLLGEFGRLLWVRQNGQVLPRWVTGIALLLALMALTLPEEQQNTARYLLGLTGGWLAALAVYSEAGRLEYGGGRLRLGAAGMVMYALLAGAAGNPAAFTLAPAMGQPFGAVMLLGGGICIAFTAACVWSAFSFESWQKRFPGRETDGPGRRDTARALLLLTIVGLGWLAAIYLAQDTEEELRGNVKNITQAAAAALSGEDVARLALGEVREENPRYQLLKRKMTEIKASYASILWVYVLVEKEGALYFLLDSIQPGEPDYSPPNFLYQRPPRELQQVFQTGRGTVTGPYTDEWGRFVSGFSPVRDSRSGSLAGVFGVDIDAGNWQKFIAKHRLAPIGVTFLIWLLTVGTFLARQRLLASAQRTAASEERLALAMQGANDGLWDWNLLNGEVYFSPQWQRMLGYEDGELEQGMDVLTQLLHPEDRERALTTLTNCSAGCGGKLEMEIRLQHKSGEYRDILSRAFAVRRDEGGKAIRLVGTHVDITERNRVNRELQTAKEAAESATRTKSTFLANMSHEIRTPMNAILGFTQLLLRDPELKAAQRQPLETINRSGEHLLALINDILEMSKVEAGRTVLCPEEFDLHQFVRDLDLLFRLRITQKGLAYQVTAEGLPGGSVIGDKQKLRQIFYNLIGNAVKFTLAGSVTVSMQLTAEAAGGWRLTGEVADTGPGIAAADLDMIFQPFSQAETGRKTTGGTGLGLTISREYARLMGGDLQVVSQEGQGCRFYLEVPLAPGRAANAEPVPEVLPVTAIRGEPEYRILIVDDTEENRQLLTSLLEGVGFLTRTALDGRQAVDLCREWQPHLVFMDMRMPVMNGFEATRAIRNLPDGDRVPVIALSASVLPEEETQAREYGVSHYLRKPFREAEIFQVIADFLPLEYVYGLTVGDSLPSTPAGPEVGEENVPPEWADAMEDAVTKAQFEQMLELLDQLGTKQPQTAERLRAMVQRYEYDQLLNLLKIRGNDGEAKQ